MYINFWYPICTTAALGEKEPVKVQVLMSRLVAFRDSTGQAHVLSDTCIHRGGSLSKGKISGDCIQCPYHGWQYGGDGRVTHIPAMEGRKPPGRAKVDSYPVQEKYGVVFAFLGDLPEHERPPLCEIPEWGQDGWRASDVEIINLNAFYERSMENGIDPAHNEFVHPLQGAPRFDASGVGYRDMPWGTQVYSAKAPRAQADTELKHLRPSQDEVSAETWNHGPNSLVTSINLSKTNNLTQYIYEAPVDENHTRIFFINMRNCMLEPENDERIAKINHAVINEDMSVLESLYPVRTPGTNTRELLGPGDEAIVRFREWLAEWRDKGWRIDFKALRAIDGDEAVAIPSPARRDSGNWVLDTVPMVPVSQAAPRHQPGREDNKASTG